MKSINDSHLRALSRSIIFTESGITKNMEPKHISSIELDIRLLKDIFAYVRQQINEPGLPMSPERIGQGINGEKDGDTDNKP